MATTPSALLSTTLSDNEISNINAPTNRTPPACFEVGSPLYTLKAQITVVIFPIQLSIAIFSLVSNFCNIVVLSRRKMINATNTILTGMAVCDLITCVAYIIRCTMTHLLKESMTKNLKLGTIIFLMICLTSHTASIWLGVLLSIFRFFIIHTAYASPRSSELWGLRRSRIATVLICASVTIFFLPVYSTLRIVPYPEPSSRKLANVSLEYYNRTKLRYFAVFRPESYSVYNFASNAILAKVVPCVLLTFFGILLLVTLHKADKRRMSLMEESRNTLATGPSGSGSGGAKGMSRRERNSRRTTRMLLTVIIIFVVVELPNGMLLVASRLSFLIRCIYNQIGEICDLASLTKNAVTFLLYCSMSTEFRHTFRSTFCRCTNVGLHGANTRNGPNITLTEDGDRKTITTAAFVVDHLTAKGKAGGYSQAV